MHLPRRLYKTKTGRICEEDDPQVQWNWLPKGYPMVESEAERIGLKAYLDATGWGEVAQPPAAPEAKAVAQAEVEDKAVTMASDAPSDATVDEPAEAPAPEAKDEPGPGLHLAPESRRGRR